MLSKVKPNAEHNETETVLIKNSKNYNSVKSGQTSNACLKAWLLFDLEQNQVRDGL